ncbi:MAG: hypothetical protein IJD67_03170 [Clostridia bacterium]|nr:hypothetical protein [Clostridia bacterium]
MLIKTRFESEEEKKIYVDKCEARFEGEMSKCVSLLAQNKQLKFITLSGPTCSGKTTAAHIIVDALEAAGHRVKVVSIDDFFYERDFLDSKEKLDYDSIETIDLELLKSVVDGIEDGKSVEIPHFDFASGHRTHFNRYTPMPGSVTIFEGIQAVYPDVSGLFDKRDTVSIYISVAQDISFDGHTVDARTVRLMRRLVRDCKKRGATPEFTLTLWESVCANEDRSIFPYKDLCDYKLDSLLGYELGALKKPLLALLESVEKGSVHENRANELKELVGLVDEIDAGLLPAKSLFREFI